MSDSDSMSYYDSVLKHKKEILETMTKEEMVDMLFKQNSLIVQQSNQLLDLANLLNTNEDNKTYKTSDANINSIKEECTRISKEFMTLQIVLILVFFIALVMIFT
jgi:hypothetical protein